MLARAKAALVGRNPRTSLWFLSVAAVLFAVTFWVLSTPLSSIDPRLAFPRLVTALVGVGAVIAAAENAYRNEGVLVSLAVGTAPPLALWLYVGQRAGLFGVEAFPWMLGFALAYGLPLGLIGFALGTEAARWRAGVERTGRPFVGRLVLWPLVVLGVAAGAGAIGYCALPDVSCTLSAVV